MKFSSLLLLIRASINKNKAKNIFFALFLTLCVVVTTLTVATTIPLWDNVENKINNHIYYRTCVINFDNEAVMEQKMPKISELEHIVEIYDQPEDVKAYETTGIFENELTLTSPVHGANPIITSGRNIEIDETNVALVPEKIKEYSETKHKMQEIDGKSLVGKTLCFNAGDSNYSVEVVGTYSLTDPMFDGKQVIVPGKQLATFDNSAEFMEEEQVIQKNIRVDNYKNLQSVKDAVDKMNVDCYEAYQLNFDVETYRIAAIILTIMVFLFILMIFVAVTAFVNSHIKARTIELALFRALGYNSKNIFMLLFAEYVFIGAIAVSVGIAISSAIAFFGLNPYLDSMFKNTIMEMSINIDAIICSIILFVILLVQLLSCILATKKTNVIKLVVLLKER